MSELPDGIDWSYLTQLLNDSPIVVECGGNTGGTTQGFLNTFPNIKIYSFEPDPRCIEVFKHNISDSRCTLYEAAISAIDGTCILHLSSGKCLYEHEHIDSSTIKEFGNQVKNHNWLKYNNSITVKAIKLDTWKNENNIGIIDFIWADVEGAEEDLILGALETLKYTRYFYTEYSNVKAYNDEINLSQILELLPDFEIDQLFLYDVLLRNKRF